MSKRNSKKQNLLFVGIAMVIASLFKPSHDCSYSNYNGSVTFEEKTFNGRNFGIFKSQVFARRLKIMQCNQSLAISFIISCFQFNAPFSTITLKSKSTLQFSVNKILQVFIKIYYPGQISCSIFFGQYWSFLCISKQLINPYS